LDWPQTVASKKQRKTRVRAGHERDKPQWAEIRAKGSATPKKKKRIHVRSIGVFPPEMALLTAAETCTVLKVSRRTLWAWSNGRHPILPPVRIGGLPRWTVASVQNVIRERTIAA